MDNDEMPQGEPAANKAARNDKWRRTSGGTLLVVSFAPWLTLAAWTAYAEAARLSLGHYPHDMWESVPASVDGAFGFCAGLSLWLLVLSVPAWSGLVFWRMAQWKDRCFWRAGVVYGLGWATLIFVGRADPVGFVDWFLD